jgi:phage recombination protein Bet
MSVAPITTSNSLVARMAARFGVDQTKLLETLKATAFKVRDGTVSNEQMMALLVVAEQYNLNPFTRELFAFPDKQNGIVPVVSVDGWARIINSNEKLDGISFRYSEELIEPGGLDGLKYRVPEWTECSIKRKDRAEPITIREYFEEVYRPPFEGTGRDGKPYKKEGPWQSHPRRFMRHKTLIQCSRLAFSFAGIYDEDEAQRIVDVTSTAEVVERKPLRDSVQRKPKEEPATLEHTEGPTLEQLLGDLQEAGSDERIDYLCGVARDHLKNGSLKAFENAASVRVKEINEGEK